MLLVGVHPFEDYAQTRSEMEDKLKCYKEIAFPNSVDISKQAKHLIQMLTQKSISGRFTPRDALQHPWITRKLDEVLPISRKEMLEQKAKNYELEQRLRKTINTLFFCSIFAQG